MKKTLLRLTVLFCCGFLVSALFIYFTQPSVNDESLAVCQFPDVTSTSTKNMVLIPEGQFLMGNNVTYAEERTQHQVQLSRFWIDKFEVTNDQFSAFVKATGYVTTAESEQLSGAAVFTQDKKWVYAKDANWKHPEGGESNLEGKGRHPVVQVSYADAKAYATWLGHDLPTEAQFEYVSQFDKHMKGAEYIANTWQGFFPVSNTADDGFLTSAPVGCFEANSFGVYDMIGNVWEWTNDWYVASHKKASAVNPIGPIEPKATSRGVSPSRVIKGGSYLCAESYCKRYRGSARQPQEVDLGTNHIGFRTVKNIK